MENRVNRLQFEKNRAESLEAKVLQLTTSAVDLKMKNFFEFQAKHKMEEQKKKELAELTDNNTRARFERRISIEYAKNNFLKMARERKR